MAAAQNPALADAIAGALQWWREAGVDNAFSDEPVAWLAEDKLASVAPVHGAEVTNRTTSPGTSIAPPAPRLDPATIPISLDIFAEWWLSEPMLAEGSLSQRVAPRGKAGTDLMVVVPEPEREDSEKLLSGPQGRLLEAMLAVFGLGPDQVYFASALPRHLPGADWPTLTASGIGDVLRKHIELAAPKRLCVFGATVLPLLSHAPPQGAADLRIFNHESVNVPMLACRSLAALLQQPRWKASVWQKWLELTG